MSCRLDTCCAFVIVMLNTKLASALKFSIGMPMDDLGGVLRNSPIAVVPNNEQSDEASQIIKGLASVPAPESPFPKLRIDPKPDLGVESCDRDFNIACPRDFVNIGQVKGGEIDYCSANSRYQGPCANEAYTFQQMSRQAKARWANMCQADWPCVRCDRDYRAVCPQSWKREGQLSCSPLPDYMGPCRGAVDFTSFNVQMLEHWSASCGAHWACRDELGWGEIESTNILS